MHVTLTRNGGLQCHPWPLQATGETVAAKVRPLRHNAGIHAGEHVTLTPHGGLQCHPWPLQAVGETVAAKVRPLRHNAGIQPASTLRSHLTAACNAIHGD